MIRVIIGAVLMFVVSAGATFGVVAGLAFLVGAIADIHVNYGAIALLVGAFYVLIAVAQALLLSGQYSEQKKTAASFRRGRR